MAVFTKSATLQPQQVLPTSFEARSERLIRCSIPGEFGVGRNMGYGDSRPTESDDFTGPTSNSFGELIGGDLYVL
jgi:hypothetical protein